MTPREAAEFADRIDGYMRMEELEWLATTAASLSEGALWVELGTWKGRSWAAAALALPPHSTIVGVDPFGGSSLYDVPEMVIVKQENPQAEFTRVRTVVAGMRPDLRCPVFATLGHLAAVHVADGSVDVVFSDSDHTTEHVYEEVLWWRDKMKPGGILCGHDGGDATVRDGLYRSGIAWKMSGAGSIWVSVCE